MTINGKSEVTQDEKRAIVLWHYTDSGIKFSREPNDQVINHLYDNLLKFNANYIMHRNNNPDMEKKLIEACKKRRIGRARLRIV